MERRKNKGIQKTQGEIKLERHLQDLIRNKSFLRLLRKLGKGKHSIPNGPYDTWTEEQKKMHDFFNNELNNITNLYMILCRRWYKISRSTDSKVCARINEEYELDGDMIEYARALKKGAPIPSHIDPPDVCTLVFPCDESQSSINDIDKIYFIWPNRALRDNVHPVGVQIHTNATKNDVLDFINKKWPLISQRLVDEKNRFQKRKRKYDMIKSDFIWEHRHLKFKELKPLLNEAFPHNGLAYPDVNAILRQEKKRRLEE